MHSFFFAPILSLWGNVLRAECYPTHNRVRTKGKEPPNLGNFMKLILNYILNCFSIFFIATSCYILYCLFLWSISIIFILSHYFLSFFFTCIIKFIFSMFCVLIVFSVLSVFFCLFIFKGNFLFFSFLFCQNSFHILLLSGHQVLLSVQLLFKFM